jgi:ribosomal protein S19E (S16A)
MNDEIDYDLSPDQWETLKALRAPVSRLSSLNRFVLEDLTALGLVMISDKVPVITPSGRKALIRGSSRLWDVAA